VAINHNTAFTLLNITFEATVSGIVFQQVDEVVDIHERIVDCHNSSLRSILSERCSSNEAADSAETIDTDSCDRHNKN